MDFQVFGQLILATIFGALLGLEREIKKKGAGLQTYSLVSLGSCLFAVVALLLADLDVIDPSPLITAIAIGMGFIGGGAIFRGENQVQGLTTAAGLWTTAAIGLTTGAGFYWLAGLATFLTIFIFAGFGLLEEKVFKNK
ncbi:MAG: MgtC/SapB family protein [Candidatus Nealsonbacteria bacterium]|nr:MgtC/SapB family protein [Candidatus Nealsonbacteria bacterium]